MVTWSGLTTMLSWPTYSVAIMHCNCYYLQFGSLCYFMGFSTKIYYIWMGWSKICNQCLYLDQKRLFVFQFNLEGCVLCDWTCHWNTVEIWIVHHPLVTKHVVRTVQCNFLSPWLSTFKSSYGHTKNQIFMINKLRYPSLEILLMLWKMPARKYILILKMSFTDILWMLWKIPVRKSLLLLEILLKCIHLTDKDQ